MLSILKRTGQPPTEAQFQEWAAGEYADTAGVADNGDTLTMVDYCRSYLAVCMEELGNFRPDTLRWHIERRLVLSQDLAMFGTADLLATGRNVRTEGGDWEGLIADLKYGKGKPVSAVNNPQLAYYAVALKRMSDKPLQRVKVVVVQPRVPSRWYTTVTYTLEELAQWEDRLISAGEEAMRMFLGLTPPRYEAGRHCWWCPARQKCATYAAHGATEGFTDVTSETSLTTTTKTTEAYDPTNTD
jgi:hypothetical protein